MSQISAPSETRANDVFQRLREDIFSCAFKPGEKLRFDDLRRRYDVSFSTLREVLVRLANEHVVVSEGQRGFTVSSVSRNDLFDLTNARVLIEREVLMSSMRNGDDEWEARILGSHHRMTRLQHRLGASYYLDTEWCRLHSRFHHALVCACDSPVLLEMREQLLERTQRYRRMASVFRKSERSKELEHQRIMDFVLRRDPHALTLIEKHIKETTRSVMEYAGHLFPEISIQNISETLR